MSKHHLEFKGFGFSLSATGVIGIVAAVVIVALLLWFLSHYDWLTLRHNLFTLWSIVIYGPRP